MSSYYEAELAKLRARDQDVDKAVQTGVTAGRGVADYLRMGFQDDLAVQQMDLEKRMQDIRDKRAQREQDEFDLKMAKVRVGAETAKAEREEGQKREAAYEKELERLKKQRAEREAANFQYNTEVDYVTKEKQQLEEQADAWGVNITMPSVGVSVEPDVMPTEPAAGPAPVVTPLEAAAARLPYTGTGVSLRSRPAKGAPKTEEGKQRFQDFTAVAPAGYGFDESGMLVADPSGKMAKERSVSVPGVTGPDGEEMTIPFYGQDKILSDAEIDKAAREFAANLELEDKRQTVMQRLAEDPLNDEFFKLAGESGVAGFIDMAIDENAAARAKAAQQAFENTLASKEASRKDKDTAAKALRARAEIDKIISEVNKTQSDMKMDEWELALKEREQVRRENWDRARIRRWNKSGRKRTREARDQYKRVFGDPLKALYKKQNKLALDTDSIAQTLPAAQTPLIQSAIESGTKSQRDNLFKGETAGMQLWNDVFAIPNGKEMLDDFVREHADAKIKDEELRAKINAYAQQLLNQHGGKKLSKKEKEKNSAQNLASMAQVLSEEEYISNPQKLRDDSTKEQKDEANKLARLAMQELDKKYEEKGGEALYDFLDSQGQFYNLPARSGESQEQATQRRKKIFLSILDEKYVAYLAQMVVSSQGSN